MFTAIGEQAPSRFPFLMILMAGLCGLAITLYFAFEANTAKNWPTATGTYVSEPAGTVGTRMIAYRYYVGSKIYEAKVLHPAMHYDVDSSVQVAYDPKSPSHAIVKAGDNTAIMVMAFVFSAVISAWSFFSYVGGDTINTGRYSNWHY